MKCGPSAAVHASLPVMSAECSVPSPVAGGNRLPSARLSIPVGRDGPASPVAGLPASPWACRRRSWACRRRSWAPHLAAPRRAPRRAASRELRPPPPSSSPSGASTVTSHATSRGNRSAAKRTSKANCMKVNHRLRVDRDWSCASMDPGGPSVEEQDNLTSPVDAARLSPRPEKSCAEFRTTHCLRHACTARRQVVAHPSRVKTGSPTVNLWLQREFVPLGTDRPSGPSRRTRKP